MKSDVEVFICRYCMQNSHVPKTGKGFLLKSWLVTYLYILYKTSSCYKYIWDQIWLHTDNFQSVLDLLIFEVFNKLVHFHCEIQNSNTKEWGRSTHTYSEWTPRYLMKLQSINFQLYIFCNCSKIRSFKWKYMSKWSEKDVVRLKDGRLKICLNCRIMCFMKL